MPIDLEKSQIQLSLRKVIELLQSQFPAEQMAAKPFAIFPWVVMPRLKGHHTVDAIQFDAARQAVSPNAFRATKG